MVAAVAGVEAVFQALDAALEGRRDKFALWLLAAVILVVAAALVESTRAMTGK